jgi:hypothetical protein
VIALSVPSAFAAATRASMPPPACTLETVAQLTLAAPAFVELAGDALLEQADAANATPITRAAKLAVFFIASPESLKGGCYLGGAGGST